MLKTLALCTGMLLSIPAMGSHFIDCDLNAEISKVENLARLGGSATFSSHPDLVASDYETVVEIEVIEVLRPGGRDNTCLPVGTKVKLYQTEGMEDVTIGNQLKLHYRNFGDSAASSISWELID